jgi:hypothetical protein
MYDTGVAGFLAAACNSNRTIDTTATLDLPDKSVPLGVKDIVSYKITSASTAGKVFAPGSFVAGQFEMSLVSSSSAVSGIDFKNVLVNKVSVQAGIRVTNRMVYIPMGNFYPEKDGISTSDDGKVVIKATDLPPVLSTQFNSSVLSLPCTVDEALSKISEDIDIPIDLNPDNFPNLSVELAETFSLVTTYREALMYIAEVLGAFVKMGRNGEILMRKVFSGLVDIGCVLDDNYLFSVSKQESTVKPFQYISIKATKDDLGITHETDEQTGCTYDIINNPLTYGHPDDFLPGLVSPTSFMEFYPSAISFHGRPDLDVGDALEYVYKDAAYILPICTHVFEYNGGFKTSLESLGSDTLKTSSVDTGLKSQITALKQNINSLIRDLTQTKSDIISINGEITDMSSVLQTAEEFSTKISKLEGDVEKLTSLTQTAENLKIAIESVAKDLKSTNDTISKNQETLLTYFDFQADGLKIGISSSNITLKLANNKVYFLKDGNEQDPVAYFSEGQLYVTDGHFLRSLVLGNFEFVPRSNGNLSLKLRG